MMRSLFSAVSGLKTHQTKMDVIGNNVSNVNTVGFKSSAVTFSEIMYQKTANASGASATTGRGGVNEKQIGLGVTMGATKITISSSGAAETTGDPFDLRLTDKQSTNFFIVSDGSQTLFTRAGSFYIDGAGNLAMTSTGYVVQGWQVDETTGNIKKDTVSALQIMQEKNQTSAPEATTLATVSGVMDKNDTNVTSDDGYLMNLNFYDKLGYQYTAKFAVKVIDPDTCSYIVELSDILDSNNKSVLDQYISAQVADGSTEMDALANIFGEKSDPPISVSYSPVGNYDGLTYVSPTQFTYMGDDGAKNIYLDYANDTVTIDGVSAGSVRDFFGISQTQLRAYTNPTEESSASIDPDTCAYVYSYQSVNNALKFNESDGTFSFVGQAGFDSVTLKLASTLGGNFSDIQIDFSTCRDADNGGKTTLNADAGQTTDGSVYGAGKPLGALTGISINNNGLIYGSYDNGNTVLLGQIPVARFPNASGLEKVGENCYITTLNSGDFDGIGVEVGADGSSMTSGELEMSNTDLSTEFTQMIITQRGFQSNSRVITVSDTLLEELINLKR